MSELKPGPDLDRAVCEKLGIEPRHVILAEPPYDGISWPPVSTDTGTAVNLILPRLPKYALWYDPVTKTFCCANPFGEHQQCAMALCIAVMRRE